MRPPCACLRARVAEKLSDCKSVNSLKYNNKWPWCDALEEDAIILIALGRGA